MLSALLLSLLAAQAHELPANTATVQLRGQHVTVDLSVAVSPWLEALDAAGTAEEQLAQATAHLLAETRLDADGQPVRFTAIRLPPVAAVEADLGEHDAPHRSVRLEAQLDAAPAALSLTLPASLGDAVITFTQPQTRWVPAGQPALFLPASPQPRSP